MWSPSPKVWNYPQMHRTNMGETLLVRWNCNTLPKEPPGPLSCLHFDPPPTPDPGSPQALTALKSCLPSQRQDAWGLRAPQEWGLEVDFPKSRLVITVNHPESGASVAGSRWRLVVLCHLALGNFAKSGWVQLLNQSFHFNGISRWSGSIFTFANC